MVSAVLDMADNSAEDESRGRRQAEKHGSTGHHRSGDEHLPPACDERCASELSQSLKRQFEANLEQQEDHPDLGQDTDPFGIRHQSQRPGACKSTDHQKTGNRGQSDTLKQGQPRRGQGQK